MTPLLIKNLSILLIAMAGAGCSCISKQKPSRGAIHQVGLVWLKKEGDPGARQKVITAVHEFERLIPEVKSASVGLTEGSKGPYSDTSFDVCFVLTFADEAARLRYAEHSIHQKAAREVFLPLSKKLLFYSFVSE